MFRILSIFFLLSFFWQQQAKSQEHTLCNDSLDSLPIQQNGRVKPLYVHASETLKFLTGKGQVGSLGASTAFCFLSLSPLSLPSTPKEIMEIETPITHVDTQKLLGVEKTKSISLKLLSEQLTTIRTEWMKVGEDNSYKKDLSKLISKIQMYQDIISGNNWTLPLFQDQQNHSVQWVPFMQYFTQEKMTQIMGQNNESGARKMPELLASELQNLRKLYIEHFTDRYLLELKFVKARLVGIALVLALISLGILVAKPDSFLGVAFTALTVLTQLIVLIFRVMISGRAPITNMYETVLFSGFGALLLAMIVGHFKKEKRYLVVGLCYNLCTLMMLILANGMLSSTIGPLVPVLRDNFWLSIHVTTIILSYGALGLSWMMSNYFLIMKKLDKIPQPQQAHFVDLVYSCLKIGTVLLAAGIILGGVWADYSWGRFWGWDPKETWSLIALCIYMAILHGRSTSWITPKRFIPFVSAAFMSVMMAWFGVNYILATGLHSYGFSEGGAVFLFTFFALQIALIIWTQFPLSLKDNTTKHS